MKEEINIKKIHFIHLSEDNNSIGNFNWINKIAIQSARTHNPDYEIILHTNVRVFEGDLLDAMQFVNKVKPLELFHKYKGNVMTRLMHMADVYRLEILISEGGIYLDTDMITLGSYDHLLSDLEKDPTADTYGCLEYKEGTDKKEFDGVNNCILLSLPNSKYLIQCLKFFENFNDTDHIGTTSIDAPFEYYTQNPESSGLKAIDKEVLVPFDYQGWDPVHLFMHKRMNKLRKSVSIHLWNNIWKNTWLFWLTKEHIITQNTTIATILKQYVNEEY